MTLGHDRAKGDLNRSRTASLALLGCCDLQGSNP
jgi:hypothetical protein